MISVEWPQQVIGGKSKRQLQDEGQVPPKSLETIEDRNSNNVTGTTFTCPNSLNIYSLCRATL
jgi:hypothetical protein